MQINNVLEFIFAELKKAIEDGSVERIGELGSTIDVLYEAAKSVSDRQMTSVLEKYSYLVFHYGEDSFDDQYFDDISAYLATLKQ